MNEIEIVKYTFKYVLLNKPSGIQCNGSNNYRTSLLAQLVQKFKQLANPSKQLGPKQFQLVQRLDKHVTGGLIVSRDPKFTKRINLALKANGESSYSLTRRYIGLIPFRDDIPFLEQIVDFKMNPDPGYKGLSFDDDTFTTGRITSDVEALEKDEYRSKDEVATRRNIVHYPASTKFTILQDCKYWPSKELKSKYPRLFKSKIIYPIVLELQTGRKNQIRDHISRAFRIPLLNDDKFGDFKYTSQANQGKIDVNSEIFKSNQIGLHSGYLRLSTEASVRESVLFPVHSPADRELWTGVVDQETGLFSREIEEALCGSDIGIAART